MSKPKKLSGKRAAFVREYLKDLNGAAAAMRAGYCVGSPDSAKVTASRLLTDANVAAAVAEAQAKAAERCDVTVDRVVREYARIAFARVTDFLEFEPGKISLKSSAQLTESAIAAIAEIREHAATENDSRTISFKLHSKTAALEALGRHLGMFNDKLEVKLQGVVEEMLQSVRARMTPDAYAQLAKAISTEMGLGDLASQDAAGSDGGSSAVN